MITVNLIPKEILRKERTPIGQFAAILLCVLAVVGSFAAYLYVEFGRRAEVESELSQVQADLELVRPHKEYADRLIREKREYSRRTETIQGIGAARVLWSKKLDEFWSVIQNDGDVDSHNVWITNLQAKSPQKRNKKRAVSGSFKISGFSASDKSRRLSNFHRDLVRSPFFKDFYDINDPEGAVVTFKDDKEPGAAWNFTFDMKMGEEPGKAKKAPRKRPARKKK